MPFVAPSIALHASVRVSAATPPVLTHNVGVTSVTRTGAGIWVVTIAEEIDFTQRFVSLTSEFATHGVLELDPAIQTDSTIGVLGFLLAIASDLAFQVKVERISSPS